MNSKITQYLIEHCIDPENLPSCIRVQDTRNRIEIVVRDSDCFSIFSKYRVFDGDMKYTYDFGAKMSLFNVHTLKKDGDVYITEGEFDCLALNKFYSCVVSSTGGCASWRDEWTELLTNRDVKICFDNDHAGVPASVALYKRLLGKVKSIEILQIKNEKDICEHIYKHNNFTPQIVIEKEISEIFSQPIKSKAQINRMQAIIENGIYNEVYRNGLLDIVSDLYHKKYRPKTYTQEERTTVEDVRKVPITNYISFTGGMACCIFHNERNPSMHYNDFNSKFPNTVKCYSCGKFADVIDVVMTLENVGFKDALSLLKSN